MERKRVNEKDSHEETYFEMHFTSSDEINSEDEMDDSSSLSDTQDEISIAQDLRLPTTYMERKHPRGRTTCSK